MIDMQDLMCYSQINFVSKMKEMGWLTIEDLPKDVAIISICNTTDNICKDEYHMFEDCPQVLNLNFDDFIPSIHKINGTIWDIGDGRKAYSFNENMAKKAVKFIDEHINSNFYVHCAAGISRSQAFIRFIETNYDREWKTSKSNPCLHPNIYVLLLLNKVKRKQY